MVGPKYYAEKRSSRSIGRTVASAAVVFSLSTLGCDTTVQSLIDSTGSTQSIVTFATMEDQPVTVSIDALPDNTPLADIVIASAPEHGTLQSLDAASTDGVSVTFNPDSGFVGEDAFTLELQQNEHTTQTAIVNVIVYPEIRFEVNIVAESPMLVVDCEAFSPSGHALPEGTYQWGLDGVAESGPMTTNSKRRHTFSATGTHVVTLTVMLSTMSVYQCSSGPSGDDKEAEVASSSTQITTAPAAALLVVSDDSLNADGTVGGPFNPSSIEYTISNPGGEPILWSAYKTQNWVSLSSSGGTLQANESTLLVVSLNNTADALTAGDYSDTVTITNATNGQGTTNRAVNLTVAPVGDLAVTPGTTLSAVGPAGGPFTPATVDYVLTNSGSTPINWTAGATANWVTLSSNSGTLAPSVSSTLTISINADANSLAVGNHSGFLTITNTTNGSGTTTRAFAITVNPLGTLAVSPNTDFSSSGTVGGPFSPATKDYVLTNAGSTTISWTASATQSWVTLSDNSGVLQPSSTTTLSISINTDANSLTAGTHDDALTITNTTNANGSTSRHLSLTVVPTSTIIVPGTGFEGDTPQPPIVGSGHGADARAIARWDVVPYQTFDDDLQVGVIAFHINGIDRVEFSANGGPWTVIREMSENPRTGVWEYFATLQASQIPDGPLELRAIAYPVVGTPRVLQDASTAAWGNQDAMSLHLYANAGGTLNQGTVYVSAAGSDSTGNGSSANPYASIWKALVTMRDELASFDGGTIEIVSAGTYDISQVQNPGLANSYWVTIRKSESLPASPVIIAPTSRSLLRPGCSKLRFEGLAFDFSLISQVYKGDQEHIWFDSCTWFQSDGKDASYPGQTVPIRNEAGTVYVTNSVATEMLYGFTNCTMVRNSRCADISGDSYANTACVINGVTDGITTDSAFHQDTHQYHSRAWENVILYNVVNYGLDVDGVQNFFLDHYMGGVYPSLYTDIAFVNIAFENAQASSTVPVSQLHGTNSHVLFINIGNPGQKFLLKTRHQNANGASPYSATNCAFINCLLEGVNIDNGADWPMLDLEFQNCHFVQAGDQRGDSPTSGAIAFAKQTDDLFLWTGNASALLEESGAVLPGYRTWKWDNTNASPPDRGAIAWDAP